MVGSTFEEQLVHLRKVFQRFRDAGLKLNPNKCSFCQTEVHFLGHIISAKGIRTDPTKTNLVASWPIPTPTKEVQKFLGLVNYYRRFVPNFTTKAKPLHKLTEKTAKFKWSVRCQEAFSELKKCLISALVLSLPTLTDSLFWIRMHATQVSEQCCRKSSLMVQSLLLLIQAEY